MNMQKNTPLTNTYARTYYDTQVAPLESYEEQRWHATPVQEFEYGQTARALRAALSGRAWGSAIEVGPGDAVWTPMLRGHVEGGIHLVEQSGEMLARARKNLAGVQHITFEHSDFLAAQPPHPVDLIVAIRCFEYFEDKEGALRKMRELLAPGGRIILVTKNPKLITGASAQHKTLHSDQVSIDDMKRMATEAGLKVDCVYPAIVRWKAAWPPMRFVFNILHWLGVRSRGHLWVPLVFDRAAESYLYSMSAQQS